MHRGSPAAAALKARSPSRSAPLGSPRTTTAIPSEASSTIRSSGASSAAVTATTASSCARSRACSGTDLRANSWIFRKTTLARVAAAFVVFIGEAWTSLRSYPLLTPSAYNLPRLHRPRTQAQERVPFGPERRGHVHDQGRHGPALPHRRGRGEGGAGPRGRDHPLPGGRAALAALPARRVPACPRAQAPAGREGPVFLVLREMPRRALPGGPPRRRLPRGPGVARLRGVLFGGLAPHLRQVRARHAGAGRLGRLFALSLRERAGVRVSHAQHALGVSVRDLFPV